MDDPASAVPLPGSVEVLADLAQIYRTVAVISGRPVAYLAELLPESVTISGLYGLQERSGGVRSDHTNAARWRPIVESVCARAIERAGPHTRLAAVGVEPKGLSLTLHFRTCPHLEDEVAALAAELAGPVGLEVRPAKRSIELHPPIAADKGTALESLAVGADAVMFVGDDVGDLPAFEALARLRERGLVTVAVAIGGPELPAQLAQQADLVLGTQADVLALLQALLPDLSS